MTDDKNRFVSKMNSFAVLPRIVYHKRIDLNRAWACDLLSEAAPKIISIILLYRARS